jgi:polysaccharide deacetylase 2 family uncharacterized protein YibQ
MIRFWCWLFATCVVATMPPAPPAPPSPPQREPYSARAAGDAAGAQQPGTQQAVRVALAPPPAPDAASLSDLVLGVAADPLAPQAEPAPDAEPAPSSPVEAVAMAVPASRRHPVPAPPSQGRPTLSLVLDGVGTMPQQAARAVALPGPLTLAWLPRAPHLADQMAAAAARGHEAMLQMPAESPGRLDPGGDALRTWLPPAANRAILRAALEQVPDAVTIDQPEGSLAALSVPLMDLVMAELRSRRMGFVDAATLPREVALARARAAGLPAAGPDLVIDADPEPAAIRARLAEGEAIARRHGHAILLGHPRAGTLDVLEQYLPTLAERGFVLWPVSATLAGSRSPGVVAAAVTGVPTGPGAEGAAAPEADAAAIAPLKTTGAE